MTFRVGQKVVCIDASKRRLLGVWAADIPVKGCVYTVDGFLEHPLGPGLILVEIKNDIDEHGGAYDARRFRPVVERKTDISVFTRLLVSGTKILEDV